MIRLNLATDYALRTLLYLGQRPDTLASAREVSAFFRISPDHVSKVVQQLAHAGYVRAGRGRGGGIRLGRPASEITVGDVVELFEGPVVLLECVRAEDVCVIQPNCRLRQVLADAGQRLIQDLKQVTLADLVRTDGAGLVHIALPEGVSG